MDPVEFLARGAMAGLAITLLAVLFVAIRALWRALHPRNIGRAAGFVEQRARGALEQFRDGRNSGS